MPDPTSNITDGGTVAKLSPWKFYSHISSVRNQVKPKELRYLPWITALAAAASFHPIIPTPNLEPSSTPLGTS